MPGQARARVWLFDLDNTLHDAGSRVFGALHQAMNDYVVRELALSADEASRLNHLYWHRYGATLLGLQRHHGVKPAHFLDHTHRLPELQQWLSGHRPDFAAIARLPGRKFILTNAPRAYALRVLGLLGIDRLFERVFSIEDMAMFGQLRPKPDARMLRRLAVGLRVPARHCTLVEDTLQHLKSARRVGMGTVWMQGYLRPGRAGARLPLRPAAVDLRLRRLAGLGRRQR